MGSALKGGKGGWPLERLIDMNMLYTLNYIKKHTLCQPLAIIFYLWYNLDMILGLAFTIGICILVYVIIEDLKNV